MKPVISSITECNDPQPSGVTNYGNGLLHYIEKEFCAHGVCKDVTVCELTSDAGEKTYYLPLQHAKSGTAINESKEMVLIAIKYDFGHSALSFRICLDSTKTK